MEWFTTKRAFQLVGTNAATPYPETVERSHEIGMIFKYKLTERLTPRVEYRYQQWDNHDYQTTVMTPAHTVMATLEYRF
jgi:predicted porin